MTQRDLADATGMPQPAIARIERGNVMPRSATLVELLRATGHELTAEPMAGLATDPKPIRAWLALSVPARVTRALGGRARQGDLSRILKRLRYFGVRFVLIGPMAEAAYGVPGRIDRLVEVCPAQDDVNEPRLARALDDIGVVQAAPGGGVRATVKTRFGPLTLDPEPIPGEGFEALSRTAVNMPVDAGILIAVAAIPDLERIRRARGGPDDLAALGMLGGLRRELESRERDRSMWPVFGSTAEESPTQPT